MIFFILPNVLKSPSPIIVLLHTFVHLNEKPSFYLTSNNQIKLEMINIIIYVQSTLDTSNFKGKICRVISSSR